MSRQLIPKRKQPEDITAQKAKASRLGKKLRRKAAPKEQPPVDA